MGPLLQNYTEASDSYFVVALVVVARQVHLAYSGLLRFLGAEH